MLTFPSVSPSIFEAAVADGDSLEMRVARLRGELDGVIAPLLTRAREPASTDADSVVGAAVSVLASDVLLRAEHPWRKMLKPGQGDPFEGLARPRHPELE